MTENKVDLFKIAVVILAIFYLTTFQEYVDIMSEHKDVGRFDFIGEGLTLDTQTGAIYSIEEPDTSRVRKRIRYTPNNEHELFVDPVIED